ncbi:MAG: GIY-YIG nuclease family protein [Candidatus Altimarinota bacterium]
MYFIYLARCSDGTLYTGYCRDLNEREQRHNQGLGAKYTRGRLPVQIVYFEEFLNRSDAMKREAEIKTWTKQQKELVIKTKKRQAKP